MFPSRPKFPVCRAALAAAFAALLLAGCEISIESRGSHAARNKGDDDGYAWEKSGGGEPGADEPKANEATGDDALANAARSAPDANPNPAAVSSAAPPTGANRMRLDELRRLHGRDDPSKPISLNFDDLDLGFGPDEPFRRSYVTPEVEKLNNRLVRMRGFFLPDEHRQSYGITNFILIRDTQECCFGPGARIYHNVKVELDPGVTANYTTLPVEVEGILRIRPWVGNDGKVWSIYHLQGREVK